MSMFSTPSAPSGGIDFASHNGALLLIEVQSLETGINTSYGSKDAVKANVHVLDGPGAPESYNDALLFPTLLVSQTKSKIGEKVLGRLGTGNQKPGQKPPWLLNEASADDVAKAEAWVKENQPTVTTAAPPF